MRFLSFFRSRGTIVNTAGTGSAVTIAAAKANRSVIMIQNTSDTVMWINFGATAAADTGISIAAGTTWTNPPHYCPTGLVSAIGTSTKKFSYLIY